MSTGYKLTAMIGIVIATLLMAACGREQNAATSSQSAAAAKEAPPALRYDDHIFAGGVAPPGGELPDPQANTAQNAKDGQALFSAMNCDGCHASDGSGLIGPSLSDGRWRYGGLDEEIFNSIFYGRPKGMPAYGGVLGQGGVWSVMSYLKSLQKPASVPTVSAPELK
jgi:mono/diheme cytochrome c family protein